jgi:hypothetical protein
MTISGNISAHAFSHASAHTAASSHSTTPGSSDELTSEEQRVVTELKKRDAEVRRHEQAHKRVAGQYALGAPKYDYQVGPDGKRYAVGGEVALDTSEIPNNPSATIRKADQIKRAALAPEKPSAQDRRVASEAERMKAKAQQELREEKQAEPVSASGYGQQGQNVSIGQQASMLSVYA